MIKIKDKEVTHKLTATKLSAVNTFLFVAMAFFGNAVVLENEVLSSINNIQMWYWGIILIIAFFVVMYYEGAYKEELRK